MRTAGLAIVIIAIISIVAVVAASTPAAAATGARTHVVQPGENLYRIAARYGVSVAAIARASGIADPARVRAGQVLVIPASGEQGSFARAGATAGSRAPVPAVPKAPAAAHTYIVQRGDTLSAVARRHATTVLALRLANGLRSDRIRAGQTLRIPASGALVPAAAIIPQLQTGPTILPPPEIGAEILAPHPLRVRRGPKTYHTTLALVAERTPLRILSDENNWYEVQLPDGEIGWVHEDDLRVLIPRAPADPAAIHGADLVREAMAYLGTPYVWGGESRAGVDCSGFVYIVFSGRLPALARLRSFDYFQMGTPVDRANLLPGDLVFFTTYAAGPSHVGIYIGDGRFIQASSGARRVIVTTLDDPYYAARYLGARRLVTP